MREVVGSKPQPDQHSVSLNNLGESASFAMTSANGYFLVFSDKDDKTGCPFSQLYIISSVKYI